MMNAAIRQGFGFLRASDILAFVVGFCLFTPSVADDAWIRIDNPDAALRAQLPAEAIDYGGFLWMPEQAMPATARSDRLTHQIEQPFALNTEDRSTNSANLRSPGRGGPLRDQDGFHLIQFRGPVQQAWLARLKAQGLIPVHFIAPNAYLVWGREDQLPSTNSGRANPVHSIGSLPLTTRFGALKGGSAAHEHARAIIYRPTINDALLALRVAGLTIRDFRSIGGELLVVDLNVTPDRFAEVLNINGVLTVQQVTQDAGPRGEMANQSVVNMVSPNQTLVPGYRSWLDSIGLDGSGVTVAVVDAGIRQTHQDLASQFLDCQPGPDSPSSCSQANDDHGTHVAGAIAGSGASNTVDGAGFLRGLGIAPGAKLVQQRYPPFLSAGPAGLLPGGMLTIFAESALSGAVLANNSWGPSSTPQGYDIPTREVDLITRNALPNSASPAPILPVWSIMNGGGDSPDSDCAPSSLGAPDEAKNVLTVGSSKLQQAANGSQRTGLFDISTNSAHGPACDGRRVPQLIAPGCYTDNPVATADDAYSSNFCGTSMASPIVTGAAALFVEQYRASNEGRTPSPALIRARLTASARNLQGFLDADGGVLDHRPDRKQGWGRLDAQAVLNPDQPVVLFDQTRILSATGQAWTGRFEPVDPAAPMQAMLAWTDAPGHGLGGALPAWINDLDLIAHAGANVFYGNGFGADGFSVVGASPDPRNNLEGVVLSAAQHGGGAVRFEVLAANIAADALDPWNPVAPAQDFALVCVNCQRAPDFTLSVSPQALKACLNDGPLTATATIRSILDFAEPVTLNSFSLDDFAGGLSLDPTATLPAGSQTLTIATDTASEGTYGIRIEGASATAGTIATTLELELDAPLNATPEALSASSGEAVSPAAKFRWSALAGADQYRFELSTDAGFSDIVESRIISDANWQPEAWLQPRTRYFWRVRGINSCGEGAASETFSLETTAGPASGLAFVDAPDPDGQGGFIAPIRVEILDALGNRMNSDNESFIELSLADFPAGTTLGGTRRRQVSAGVASFDDLTISAQMDGEFTLRAALDADEVLDLTSFEINTRDPVIQQQAAGLSSSSSVTGLAFSGTVTGITGSPSFASDLRLAVTGPNGGDASLGGFDTASDSPWGFGGEASANDGSYESVHPLIFSDSQGPLPDEGFWSFEFGNDFSGGEVMRWDNVQITLIKQPLVTDSGTIPIQGSRIFRDRFEVN